MKLSTNFTLDEFLVSQTAERHGISMDPPPEVIENLRELCETILQPLRDSLGSVIIVTSGWRPLELNRLIGSSDSSQHPKGEAADIRAVGYSPIEVAKRVEQLDLPVHQCILEFGRWCHLSKKPKGRSARRQYLTALREHNKTVYKPGLIA